MDEGRLKNAHIVALVPAAGKGLRMSNEEPKQYIKVIGHPIIEFSVMALLQLNWIKEILVVVDDEEKMKNIFREKKYSKVKILELKNSIGRHYSIKEGLEHYRESSIDYIIIHDGVRPIVPTQLLIEVTLKAMDYGASGIIRPLVSTVISPDASQLLNESLDRSKYFNSEMPQAFHYKTALEAYRRCSKEELEKGTECLSVILNHMGVKAHLVKTSTDLWKVTYPRDVIMAEAILPSYYRRVGILGHNCNAQSHSTDEIETKPFCPELHLIYSEIEPVLNENSNEIVILNHHPVCEADVVLQLMCIDGFDHLENKFAKAKDFISENTQSTLNVMTSKVTFSHEKIKSLMNSQRGPNVSTTVVLKQGSRQWNTLTKIIQCFLSKFGSSLIGQVLYID